VLLGHDGNPLGIQRPREGRGVYAALDVGDLRGRKGHHPVGGIVPVDDVEVVEVPPRSAHDDDPARLLGTGGFFQLGHGVLLSPLAAASSRFGYSPPPATRMFLSGGAHVLQVPVFSPAAIWAEENACPVRRTRAVPQGQEIPGRTRPQAAACGHERREPRWPSPFPRRRWSNISARFASEPSPSTPGSGGSSSAATWTARSTCGPWIWSGASRFRT